MAILKNNPVLLLIRATIASLLLCLSLIFLFPLYLRGMEADRIEKIKERQMATLNIFTFTDKDYFRLALRPEQIDEIVEKTNDKNLEEFVSSIHEAIKEIRMHLNIEKHLACYLLLGSWTHGKKTMIYPGTRVVTGKEKNSSIGIPNELDISFNNNPCAPDTLVRTILNRDVNPNQKNIFLENADRIAFIKEFIVVKIVRALNFSKLLENENLIPQFLESFGNKKWLLFLGLFENIVFHASNPAIQTKSNENGERKSIWRSEAVQKSNIDFLDYLIQSENVRLLAEEKEQLEPIIQKGLIFCRSSDYQDEYNQNVVNQLEESFKRLFQKPVQEPNPIEIILESGQKSYRRLILHALGIGVLGGLGIYAAYFFAKKYGYIKK